VSLEIERFDVPLSTRAARAEAFVRNRAVDRLAGRTVWSAGAPPRGRERGSGLREHLDWAHDRGVVTAPLDVEGSAPLDISPSVRRGDVVVLHDLLSAALAQAIRDGGGHALWHLRIAAPARGARSEEAWSFLRGFTSGVDAYLLSWSARGGRGGPVQRITALVPSARLAFAKEVTGRGSEDLAWASLLADVLDHDRLECVGGTLHVRPTVAAR
jgi:hypothetical protein